ncbi:MAG: chemotaxis protein CheX [Leptospiraceae bacterium]|nr:chemotaxis protein CheX [Leptospiraceae bacterium]MCP5494728.1 chemotaxis protein CheX [Leptospiraceae bacterium]
MMSLEITPFIDALNQTFEDMVEIKLNNEPVEILQSDTIYSDVSSSIGIFNEKQNMSLVISVSFETAIFMTQRVTGKKNVNINDKIIMDTIGEILNMIVGSAQKRSEIKFDFSIPISIKGKDHEVCTPMGHYKCVTSKFYNNAEKLVIGLYLVKIAN